MLIDGPVVGRCLGCDVFEIGIRLTKFPYPEFTFEYKYGDGECAVFPMGDFNKCSVDEDAPVVVESLSLILTTVIFLKNILISKYC